MQVKRPRFLPGHAGSGSDSPRSTGKLTTDFGPIWGQWHNRQPFYGNSWNSLFLCFLRFGSANGSRTRLSGLKGQRANRCTIAPLRNFITSSHVFRFWIR